MPGPARPGSRGRPGLRERKKARTRAAIREHALRLFREQGYDATTVEQIAEAAEVSPSTFFRYFPTKEDVVLQDDMELLWMDVFLAQPADMGPIAALRTAVRAAFDGMAARSSRNCGRPWTWPLRCPLSGPGCWTEFARTTEVIAEAVAERTGKAASDFEVQALAGCRRRDRDGRLVRPARDLDGFGGRLERGLALLEAGLPL